MWLFKLWKKIKKKDNWFLSADQLLLYITQTEGEVQIAGEKSNPSPLVCPTFNCTFFMLTLKPAVAQQAVQQLIWTKIRLNATFLYLSADTMNSCLLLRKSYQSSKDHNNCEPHHWCGLCSMLINVKGLAWQCNSSQCSQHLTACRVTILSSTTLNNKPVN